MAPDAQQPGPCIAITFLGPQPKNGRRVFESFLEANKSCFWNRDLVAAMDSMIYMGFMRPGTLFVSAPASRLDTIRSAWARRVLKPALGYQIQSLGDLGAIQTIQQTQFVPLGDVLCDAIAHLNRNGQAATLATIRDHISRNCAQVASPTLEMLRQTTASLATTGLVYQMGEHFFVSVPAQLLADQENQSPQRPAAVAQKVEPKQTKTQDRRGFGILAKLFRRAENKREEQKPQPAAFSVPPVPQAWTCGTRMIPEPCPAMPKTVMPAQPPSNVCTDAIAQNLQKHLETNYLKETTTIDRRRKTQNRRAERRQRAPSTSHSSSECLNYGPVDPPECLPRNAEYVDDLAKRRKRNAQKRESYHIRASTPVTQTDSAYSPSPVNTEEEHELHANRWSDEDRVVRYGGSDGDVTHTYVNLRRMSLGAQMCPPPPRAPLVRHEDVDMSQEFTHCNDTTQFEEFTTICPPSPPHPRRYINLISNL